MHLQYYTVKNPHISGTTQVKGQLYIITKGLAKEKETVLFILFVTMINDKV